MIGTTVRHYRIVEKIGEGGMGEVYRAEDASLNRSVALKFLPEHLQEDEVARKRFLREAESAAALEHPYICNIKEVSRTDDGQDFIVMEYVEGQTLKERLEEEGPLQLGEALRISTEVADALEMAHGKGIVHRDLKPSNIMLTPQGHAKVMDFGLAKRVITDEGTEQDMTSGITKEGATLGTPAYMSPEQVRTDPVDSRSDLFSLGIVLYEMLTGVHPFLRASSVETMGAILYEDPEPLGEHLPDSPELLRSTVSQLLTKNPEARLQTIEQLSSRLIEISSGQDELRLAAFIRSRLGRRIALGLVAILVSLFIGQRLTQGVDNPLVSSIAVLPMVNLSGDPEQEYFVDGMTDELTTSLSKISSLKVTSLSAARRFRDSEMSPAEIARELGVEALVTGSILREGDQVRVAAQLVDPSTERNFWAQTFERNLTSVMALYGEVTQAIANEIQVTLTPDEESRIADTQEVNPEAYDAYLQGVFHWKKLTPEGLDLAQQYFELAMEKDSTFALAYVGLSRVWGGRGQMGLASPQEAGSKANEFVRRAIELDDGLAEAHHALASHLTWSQWLWDEAWDHWRRALAINPNDAMLNAYYAHFLCVMGLPEDALPFAERSLVLDPFSALYQALFGMTLVFNRRYDEAIVAATAAREIDPTVPVDARQSAYIASGMREEQLTNQRERIADDPERVAALERGLAEGGYEGAQLAIADLLASQYGREGYGSFRAWGIGLRYLDGGDLDRAMDWFERAVEAKDPNMPYIGLPTFDAIRAHPRYPGLIRRMNFPEEVIARYLNEVR
ncbi:MAG: protein kinase [Gemmatimonadota bacterium]